jgi:signal transduction histidine kinase
VYDVCDRYSSVAEEHGLELHIEGDLSECPMVFGNPDRVEQMFIILLDNAIKYTEEGSVSVNVDWDEEVVRITVRDTGIGIAEEDIPKVFSRFWRSEVSRERATGGLGVGLAITKEIVDQHNGTIEVESELGKGTTFTLRLPITHSAKE